MNTFKEYIIEKLKIDKDIQITKFNNADFINPTDTDLAEEVCGRIDKLKKKIDYHEDGYLLDAKLKMIINKNHFCIRPDNLDDNEQVGDNYDVAVTFIHELEKLKLGHLYMIVGTYTKKGVKYYYYFFGRNGEIFNDKKDAQRMIDFEDCRFAPWDTKREKYRSLTFKPMKIEELDKIPWDRTHSLNDIRFY